MAGRRSGKSLLAVHEIARTSCIKGPPIWVVAPTYELTTRIFDPLWVLLDSMGFIGPGSSRYDLRIVNAISGTVIEGKSADSSKSLIGAGLRLLVMDEAARVQRMRWFHELRPTLSDTRGRALLITTPLGRSNWIFDLYENAPADAEWERFKFESWQNPVAFPGGENDPEIMVAKASFDAMGMPEIFDQEYAASFAHLTGRVWRIWNAERMVRPPKDVADGIQTTYGGIDWGHTNPAALVVGGKTGDGAWRVPEEWFRRGQRMAAIIAAIKALSAKWHVSTWYADPSEPGLIQECRAAGIDVRRAINDITIGKMAVASAMAHAGFGVSFACPNLIREIEGYHYREGSDVKDANEQPVKVDDHAVDAMRYMITSVENEQRTTPRSAQVSW